MFVIVTHIPVLSLIAYYASIQVDSNQKICMILMAFDVHLVTEALIQTRK